jgi:hypothetical protein
MNKKKSIPTTPRRCRRILGNFFPSSYGTEVVLDSRVVGSVNGDDWRVTWCAGDLCSQNGNVERRNVAGKRRRKGGRRVIVIY